ncbi:hypothetical protein AA650_11980 [Anabaena sp. WA102]|nr:hypothetical protein AA650_11980 [Anabaena sp. WA102]
MGMGDFWEWFLRFFSHAEAQRHGENLIVYLFVMDYNNKAAQIINLSFFICVYLRSSAFDNLFLDI